MIVSKERNASGEILGQQLAIIIPLGNEIATELDGIYGTIASQVNITGPNAKPHHIQLMNVSVDDGFSTTFQNWIHRWLYNWKPFSLRFNNFSGRPPHQVYLRGMWYNHAHHLTALERLAMDITPFSLNEVEINSRLELPLFVNLPGMLFDSIMSLCARMQFAMELQVTELQLVDIEEKKAIAVFPLSEK